MSQRPETLRIVQFDDDTRELMQELNELLRGCRSVMGEVDELVGLFLRTASFDISEYVTDDGDLPTFTFADLE